MRTIKFRYRIYSITEKRVMEIFHKSIDEIQNGLNILCDKINYEILSRDQFTGLIDKNGNEIYEGDIVEFIDWRCSRQQWLYKSSQFDGYIKGFRGVIKWTKQGYFLDKKNQHNDKILEPKKLERGERHNPYIYHNSDIEKKELSVEIIGNIYDNPELTNNPK